MAAIVMSQDVTLPPEIVVLVNIRIARLAFLGQISKIWPRFKLVVLKKFNWSFGLFLA